jgi:capsular exopolysaccharide synthesis family protein
MLARNTNRLSSLDDVAQPPAGSHPHDRPSFWLVLRWRAKLVVASALAAILIAGVLLAVLPNRYKATTIVLVDPRQPRVTNNEVISGIGSDAAAVESQVELIESSALAKKVIDRLKLAEDPEFAAPSLLEQLGTLLRATPPGDAAEERLNRLVYRFRSGLNVRRRGLTYVLEINFTSKDPARAALISQTVAELYIGDQRASRAEITTRASGWLDERLTAMRDRVRDAERAVADYKAANGIVDVTQGNKLISRQIEDLTQQLALARAKRAEARARLERAEQVSKSYTDPAALAESLQSPVIANLRQQYAEAARLNAENSALLGDRHPSLIAVRSQLQTIRRQIEQEIARIISGISHDHHVAEDREKELEQGLAKLANQSATATQADVRLHELEREAQATRSLFEQFLQRARETSEQQSLQFADARIISPALTPLRQDRPPTFILLAAAGAAGVMLGFGLVLLMEHMRRGIRDGAEIESLTSLPYIASVPLQGSDGAERSSWWRRLTSPKRRPAHPVSGHVMPAYMGILGSLRMRLRAGNAQQRGDVVVVISAFPQEGKSTFACNFARAAAFSGLKTLLIDGDVHNASATRDFHISGAGLWELLNGNASLWSAIRQDSQSALSVLGARDVATPSPRAPNFRQTALTHILADCRRHFDLIVVDSPALLPMIGSTLPLIESSDRALLIVQWEATDRQAVLESLAALGAHTRKIVGVVLNKVATDWYRLFDSGRYAAYSENAPGIVPAPDLNVARSFVPAPNAVETAVAPRNARAKSVGFRLD